MLKTEPLSHSEFISIIQDINKINTKDISDDDILPIEVNRPETIINN